MKSDLDGTLIVRYAPSYSGVGGISHHLQVLNRSLLARNRTEIHQTFPAHGPGEQPQAATVPLGLGIFHFHPLLPTGTAPTPDTAPVGIPSSLASARTGFMAHSRIASRALAFDPRWIHLTRHLPGVSAGAKVRLKISDALFPFLSQLRKQHPGQRLLYVDHSPNNEYACHRIAAARSAGFTPMAIYHGGFTETASRVLRLLPRGTACGGVTLQGHSGELGPAPCRLGNGIDTVFFDPACSDRIQSRRQLGLQDHETVLFLPASLLLSKGHLDLTEAALRLHQRHHWRHTVIHFAGSPRTQEFQRQLEEATQSAAAKTGFRFLISRHLSPEALRDAYRAADLVVLPSHTEGIPRVILEAQAMGIPVVATDVGGTREALIDRTTGLLTPPKDVDALANSLHQMYQFWKSGAYQPHSAREFVHANYGLDALAERHERFYLESMQRHA